MRIDNRAIQEFVNAHDYDIRKTHNGRFTDQKCIPDVVNAVAECVVEYIGRDISIRFTKNDIWHSEFSRHLLEDSFSKPDTENAFTQSIIALTGTEHYSYAHPNRNTQRTDPDYQMICLISKLDSIERNFQNGSSDYSLEDFTKVLNEGLDTQEFSVQMGFEAIKARLLSYLRPL